MLFTGRAGEVKVDRIASFACSGISDLRLGIEEYMLEARAAFDWGL